MLRVTKLSGEEVASIAVGEVSDVRSLNRRLAQLPGLPPRFRQRLLSDGRGLEDDVMLDSPMDLQLVLLPFADVSQAQAFELIRAAWDGAVAKAGVALKRDDSPLTKVGEKTDVYIYTCIHTYILYIYIHVLYSFIYGLDT